MHKWQDQQLYELIVYRGRSLNRGSVNELDLLLVIYVQGKDILHKSCIHENIFCREISEVQYGYSKAFSWLILEC